MNQQGLNMRKISYDSLIKDFCRLCPEEDAEEIQETGAICIEGINFSFAYVEEVNQETMFVICDLGPLGNADEKACYRRMLEINFILGSQGGVQMAVNPDDGMPVMVTPLQLDDLTADLLMGGLRSSVQFAKQWQTGEFKAPLFTP